MPGSANPIGLASQDMLTDPYSYSPLFCPWDRCTRTGVSQWICGTFSLTSREGPSTILSEVKDMGDEAQDYTATGPTDIGFRTGGDGTGIDNGVVAQGKITGVTGIGLAAPGTSPADQPIGVVGKGQTGVVGLGHQPEGTTPDSSVGVFGQGGVGVRGSTEGAGESA